MEKPLSAAKAEGLENVSSMGEASAAKVTHLKENISQLKAKAQETASDVAHKAQEYGGKAVEETRSYVRHNPGQSLLIGFGAGLVIGYTLSRK